MRDADMYYATADIYVTRPGLRIASPQYVVPASHPHAYVLVAKGSQLPLALAERYGLLDPAPAPETAPADAVAIPPTDLEDTPPPNPSAPPTEEEQQDGTPETKAKRPVADKAIKHPPEDK